MNKRKLGQSGLETFPLALGGNVFGWTADESSLEQLDDLIEATRLDLDRASIEYLNRASTM